MSFYNTGNPVPSIDPRDLDDNAQHIDELTNSTELTFVDRLGTERLTLAGIEAAAADVTLRADLADPNGATLVTFTPEGAGAVDSDLQRKGREQSTIRDFGGPNTGNGVTDDSAAALAMASAMGFVRFSRGNYVLNTCTLDVPVDFDRKANITVPAANTVTFTNSIESPRQNIFKGAGLVVIGHDSDSGEDARHIHVSWFGAFPNPSPGPDQMPAIQRAMTAVGNSRESVIDFDIGNYNVDSQGTTTRGAEILGSGQRRTVFKTATDGFPIFVTGATACRFTAIQFEVHTALPIRTSPWIRVDHDACDIRDTFYANCFEGIVVNAPRCNIYGVKAVYAAYPGAGSSLIRSTSGDLDVENVKCLTSAFGPDVLVDIGTGAGSNISNVTIQDVASITPSIPVRFNAITASIFRSSAESIRYNGSSGGPADMVQLITGGSSSISVITIDGVIATPAAQNGVRLEQNSSGSINDINIDNVILAGTATGYGVAFIRTAGTLGGATGTTGGIDVSSGVNVRDRATPFSYSGTMGTNIKIDPNAQPNGGGVPAQGVNIADDGVFVIDLHRSVFTGKLSVTVQSVNAGDYIVRAATSPVVTVIQQTANMAAVNTALTGTTGTDGKFTIGIIDKTIYLENRLGSSQRVAVSLMTGDF